MFPIITNILVGFFSIIYIISLYKPKNIYIELFKSKYYIYSSILFILILLGFYIIKTSPNPAYFRVFVAFEIILILLFVINYEQKNNVSYQSCVGILLGCIGIILISLDNNENKK